ICDRATRRRPGPTQRLLELFREASAQIFVTDGDARLARLDECQPSPQPTGDERRLFRRNLERCRRPTSHQLALHRSVGRLKMPAAALALNHIACAGDRRGGEGARLRTGGGSESLVARSLMAVEDLADRLVVGITWIAPRTAVVTEDEQHRRSNL